MKKFIILPDNTRVNIKIAKLSNIPGILQLYNEVYSGKYTLPEATVAEETAKKIKDSNYLWIISTHHKKIVGSVIFALESVNRLGKVYAAVVLREYQGKNIMQYMSPLKILITI
jgi:hypothetical protein